MEPELDESLVAIVDAQIKRDGLPPPDEPLTQLQLDILELEEASFNRPGEKLSEFKRRHPTITMAGYNLVLLRLLADPRAYEYDGARYAGTLARIQRLHAGAGQHRSRLRGDVAPE